MDHLDITNRFMFHPATEETGKLHELVRNLCLDTANGLNELLPDGREKALAFTHLQEAMMWANAAIACTRAPSKNYIGPTRSQP